jgi:aminoglycoside N3'-acetyltransferase
MTAIVTVDDIRTAVRELELDGQSVCLHTSVRSFGPLEQGAHTIVDAFLAEGCTLLVPTFAHGVFGIRPPPDMRPVRNGWDYSQTDIGNPPHDRVFDRSTRAVDESMGALPHVLVRRPDRVRGNHPLSSFSAIGPGAAELVHGQSPFDPYAPLRAVAERGGSVVLLGVDLNRMTLIHEAERTAGRTGFRRWVNGADGTTAMVESGGCSEGFGEFEPVLAPCRREVVVGRSRWQVFPARVALERATEAIERDPGITHCGLRCDRCDDAVAGGPIV